MHCRGEGGQMTDRNSPSLLLQVPWLHLPASGSAWGSSCGNLCFPGFPKAQTVGPWGQCSSVPSVVAVLLSPEIGLTV